MPNRTLVPDKLQGYLLQVRHMLYELISVDDRIVSIEKLDDVAVEADGKVIAEQVKSVTSANNPIAERSSVFWKTLYNWCTYIETGALPSGAIMRFVVVSNGIVTPGSIQASFMNACSDSDAQKALADAKKSILGTAQDNFATDMYAALPDSYREYIRYLFDGNRTKIVCDMIKSMEIEIHNNTYDEDLLNRFSNQVGLPAEYVDLLLTDMLGWVTQTVESFTKDNKPAYISAAEYRKALNTQIRAYNTNAVLRAVSQVPSKDEQSGEIERLDTYIRQLQLANAENNDYTVSDYAFLNPKRTLAKNQVARSIDMSQLSTSGAFPSGWEMKPFNGGMRFTNGDTLLARITPCLENGKTAFIDFLDDGEVAFGSTEYIVLAPKNDTPPEMLYCLARYPAFVDYAVKNMNGSSGRQRVSAETVGQYRLPLFDKHSLVLFKEVVSPMFLKMRYNSLENMRLAELRDALLPKLMSGEIDVSAVQL